MSIFGHTSDQTGYVGWPKQKSASVAKLPVWRQDPSQSNAAHALTRYLSTKVRMASKQRKKRLTIANEYGEIKWFCVNDQSFVWAWHVHFSTGVVPMWKVFDLSSLCSCPPESCHIRQALWPTRHSASRRFFSQMHPSKSILLIKLINIKVISSSF